MEELYKDINQWIEEERGKEINQLADILFEGFMWLEEQEQNKEPEQLTLDNVIQEEDTQ